MVRDVSLLVVNYKAQNQLLVQWNYCHYSDDTLYYTNDLKISEMSQKVAPLTL